MKSSMPLHRRLSHFGGLFLALIISISIVGTAFAAEAPPISVNGSRIAVPAIQRGNDVFVPVRGVFESLSAGVAYLAPRTVIARREGSDFVRLTLGSRAAIVNGARVQLATAPFRSNGRVFVPLRLISQAAGATVLYHANPRSIEIDRVKHTAAVAAPVVVASAAPAPVAENAGIPWWVWLLIALAILALLLFFLRRRKPDPVIRTRSTPSNTSNTRR